MGRGGAGGVPHGSEIVRFGEAVTVGDEDIAAARTALIEAVGQEGFVEAACVVAIFTGLVRTADASGIPLDEGTRAATADFRDELGLHQFGGASNTDLDAPIDASSTGGGLPKLFK